ncbi:hypothetical protein GY45DRAFT_715309 [Cubamyces sp. BRFM 1775]|nr:hypothetical protein GY45DRAFT_715309 [Cubamyces sp. BRFM 1775]
MPLFLARIIHIIPCEPATARAGGSSALRVICTSSRRCSQTHSNPVRNPLCLVHERSQHGTSGRSHSVAERERTFLGSSRNGYGSLLQSLPARGSYLGGCCEAGASPSSVDPPLSLAFSMRIRLWGRTAISYTSFSGHSPVVCPSSHETEAQVRP